MGTDNTLNNESLCSNEETGYLRLAYKNVKVIDGIGYLVEDQDKYSQNFGYKALLDDNLQVLIESNAIKDLNGNKRRGKNFSICGELVIEYNVRKLSNYDAKSYIENIYRITVTKDPERPGNTKYKLVKVTEVQKYGLEAMDAITSNGKIVAYIGSYKQKSGKKFWRGPIAVIYDTRLKPVLLTKQEIEQICKSKNANSKIYKRIGYRFTYINGKIRYMHNSGEDKVLEFKPSNDGKEISLVELV